jgi:hypothetical protein
VSAPTAVERHCSCTLWGTYGFLVQDFNIMLCNAFGLALGSYYCFVYASVTTDKACSSNFWTIAFFLSIKTLANIMDATRVERKDWRETHSRDCTPQENTRTLTLGGLAIIALVELFVHMQAQEMYDTHPWTFMEVKIDNPILQSDRLHIAPNCLHCESPQSSNPKYGNLLQRQRSIVPWMFP